MALVPEDKERHVIPNWRGFSLTASQRELSAFTLENKRKIDISEYIYDWKHNRNISYAGDLIGAAIANNLPINEDIQDAAVFVLHNVENGVLSIDYTPDIRRERIFKHFP